MWPAESIPGQTYYVVTIAVLSLLAAASLLRAWFYDRAKGKPRCRRCGYPAPKDAIDQAGPRGRSSNPSERAETTSPSAPPTSEARTRGANTSGGWSCPECGWSPKRPRDFYRTRRSRKGFALTLLLLVGAGSTWYAIHVQFRRLKLQEPTAIALTPTTWWIAVLPYRTGNEDLIVYHRAYPEGMLSGSATRQLPLPGSGRTVAMTQQQYQSRDPGRLVLPHWQSAFGASRCCDIMQDLLRSEADRADAVWLYSHLSGVDSRVEVQTLASLVEPTTPKVYSAIFARLLLCETAPDIIAALAARVIEDDRYTDRRRQGACIHLAKTGDEAEPYLLDWLSRNNSELDDYTRRTFNHMETLCRTSGKRFDPLMIRITIALLDSPHPWNILTGLSIYPAHRFYDWKDGDHLFTAYELLQAPLSELVSHSDGPIRIRARLRSEELVKQLTRVIGRSDTRVLEAWGWLYSLSIHNFKSLAIEQVYLISEQNLGPNARERDMRVHIRRIVKAWLNGTPGSNRQNKLLEILELVDLADANDPMADDAR